MTTTQLATIVSCVVQTAPGSGGLPSNTTSAGWTTRAELLAMKAEEGSGQNLGSAEIQLYVGNVSIPGGFNLSQTYAFTSYLGSYVRILIHNQASGTITIASYNYDVLWTGIINRQKTMPNGASAGTPTGTQTFECVGLGALLDEVFLGQGQSYGFLTGVQGGPWDPGYLPIFNALPTKNTNTLGERSSLKVPNQDGSQTAYGFDFTNRPAAWTATDVINYLFAFTAQPVLPPNFTTLHGPKWVLSDPLSALAYVPDKSEYEGKTIMEAINQLITPRRGTTWRATHTGTGQITLTVYSAAASAITAGSFTIPASTTTIALDTRNSTFIDGLTISQDINAKYDYIQVDGNHPLVGMSLYFNTAGSGSLVKGWDSSLETGGPNGAWDSTLAQGDLYANVWRRFIIQDSWDGTQYNLAGHGLRNVRTVATDHYDGTRSYDNTKIAGPGSILKLDRFIPLPANTDYTSTPAVGSLDMTLPLLAPMVFIVDSGVYTDITDEFSITLEEHPAAVVLEGDANDLANRMTGTATLVVTVGIREQNPLMVSWNAGSGNWDRDMPKVLVRKFPFAEQWIALQGTVMGVNSTGTGFLTLSGDLMSVDDTPKLNGWLAMLRTWYGQAATTVTWTDRSQVDYATGNGTCQPGSLVTTVHRGDIAITVNAVITARAWDLSDEGWGTTYTTERVIPDVSAIESHPRVERIFRSNAENESVT